MKNIFAGFLCVCLCIAVAVFIPKVGTSNPDNDPTGCLVSGCHPAPVGEGLHATHSGFDCSVCHGDVVAGPVGLDDCRACHVEDLCDLVNLHGAGAGCLASECHIDCELAEGCTVTIACEETTLCTDDGCTTCTATTECDGEPVDGVYTWSLNMAAANTGNSIEICPDDLDLGSNELMVTDTANDAEATETLTLEECGTGECVIDVLRDSLPKSNWFALPLVFRIETIGIDPLNILTPVTIECNADGGGLFGLSSVLQTGKVIQPPLGTNTTVIWQTVIVWPTWITQSGGRESETCTVTVGECAATDTFELSYLPFFLSN